MQTINHQKDQLDEDIVNFEYFLQSYLEALLYHFDLVFDKRRLGSLFTIEAPKNDEVTMRKYIHSLKKIIKDKIK